MEIYVKKKFKCRYGGEFSPPSFERKKKNVQYIMYVRMNGREIINVTLLYYLRDRPKDSPGKP